MRVGFAGRYKVGLWTPLDVTVRGGSDGVKGRVRATVSDSDGLNCMFEAAAPCNVSPEQEVTIPLYVRFGHEVSELTLELFDGTKPVISKVIASGQSSSAGQVVDALRPGQRLIVSVGALPDSMADAMPNSEGRTARNVVAALDDLAALPECWQGYEGVDTIVLSTGRREVLTQLAGQKSCMEALDQWVHMGGTLVLCAGENAQEALNVTSPLARFAPGRYETTLHLRQTSGWETLAKSLNPIPPPRPGAKVDLPIAKLAGAQGQVEAREADTPLVIRKARGLGQVVFVATDLDRGPMLAWSDRPLLLAAILGLLPNEPPAEANSAVQSYGFDDLAGQLRSSLEQFRGVRLVPFFVVATLVLVYVLLIGPGDYFLLRRWRHGMRWTWITFPLVVILFAAAGYWAPSWLKRDVLRVNQVDLIDIADDGTARGATWFSIFSPRAETFDLSLCGRLPNGDAPQSARGSLAWFGKAGSGFNGMNGRDSQNTGPLWSQGYSIDPALDSIRDVPVQVWSCKNFVYRWLGHAPDQGLDVALHVEEHQLGGTITNNIQRSDGQVSQSVMLSHAYLVYDGWAYALGTLPPGQPVDVGSARHVSLNTFISTASIEDALADNGEPEKVPYDMASRDAAYVLRAMLFYDAAGGRNRTHIANDYQGFTDLSAVLRAGRAVLVAMPPQEDDFRGADVLGSPASRSGEAGKRLAGPLDRHTIIYRFVVPVGK